MIGFGISCCNRLEYTKECVEAVLKLMPDDAVLVISDDCSVDGTAEWLTLWYTSQNTQNIMAIGHHGERVGISRNKASIVDALLYWPDLEEIILIEDDVVPVKEGWWKAFTETARENCEAHLLWLPTDTKFGPPKKTTGNTASRPIVWKHYCSGLVMYFRASLLREIGNFDLGFQNYGWEHNDLSNRCLVAQWHSPKPYPHCYAAEKFLVSKDLEFETSAHKMVRTFGDMVDCRKLAERNRPLYEKKLSIYRRYYSRFEKKSAAEQNEHRRRYFRGPTVENPIAIEAAVGIGFQA